MHSYIKGEEMWKNIKHTRPQSHGVTQNELSASHHENSQRVDGGSDLIYMNL